MLYELLTGRRAFEGETASEILASVLKSDVDFTALPARLNPRITEMLRRCLEKNPKKRWHAAADVRLEIEALLERGVIAGEPPAAHASPRPLWKRAAPVGLGMIVAGLVAAYGAWTMKREQARPVMRFSITL